MFDIITFGSAIQDNFLEARPGSKVFVDTLKSFSGGGGTNTACSFALKGFRTAYFGKVGDDKDGEAIIKDLKRFGVSVKLVKKDKKYPTAHSFVFSLEGERTILINKGACHFVKKQDIPFEKLKAKWFYIAPLSGESAKVF